MRFIPKITYDAGTVLLLTLPQRLWEPSEGGGLAGEDESASGIPESYVVRYDHTVDVTLRFTDDERVAVLSFLEWAIRNKSTAFTFRFDAGVAVDFSMYLVSPKAGETVKPVRDAQAKWVWEQTITMRNVAGTRIHVPLVIG